MITSGPKSLQGLILETILSLLLRRPWQYSQSKVALLILRFRMQFDNMLFSGVCESGTVGKDAPVFHYMSLSSLPSWGKKPWVTTTSLFEELFILRQTYNQRGKYLSSTSLVSISVGFTLRLKPVELGKVNEVVFFHGTLGDYWLGMSFPLWKIAQQVGKWSDFSWSILFSRT